MDGGPAVRNGVGVVLAGGGARGAYEAGALSVLLPAIEPEGHGPLTFVGTSAGSINAVGLASLIHLGAEAASAALLNLWRQTTYRSVFRRGRGTRRPLDTTPLYATLDRLVDWDQLHANVASGTVGAVAVTATSFSTLGTTVFVEGGPTLPVPEPDPVRGIEYVGTSLTTEHVVASAANPAAFPAVMLERPPGVEAWYADGGIRLNTPIKPALKLMVNRVVVVATAPAQRPSAPVGPPRRPGVVAGNALLAYAVLDDRMVEDLHTLAGRNEEASAGAPHGHGRSDLIPYLFAGPPPEDGRPLGRLVADVLSGRAEPARSWHGFVARRVRRKIGRFVAADPARGELASHLFFEPEFMDGAIRLGQHDARATLDADGRPDWQSEARR